MIKQTHSSESRTAAHDPNTVRLTPTMLNSMSVSDHSGVLLLADAKVCSSSIFSSSQSQVPALHMILPLRQEDAGTMFPCCGGASHRRHISSKKRPVLSGEEPHIVMHEYKFGNTDGDW